MKNIFLSTLLLGLSLTAVAQTRYVDDVFSRNDVVFNPNVPFGQNYYFLSYPPAPSGSSSSNPLLGDLFMDMYTPPATDMATDRPVVIMLHTGSFLPKYINGSYSGNNKDSALVELCVRMAMKGYVVAAPTYRIGWNPFATSQIERTAGILNAVYRAIHDAQTAVRYFKKEAATYNIHPGKIILIGQGSGGYITLAYGTLNRQEETALPKFLLSNGNSVINDTLVGSVNGTGGLFNNYNHPGYENYVAMVANLGGAIGDISWMQGEWQEPPVASIHTSLDIYAPIDSGVVIVPTTGQPVVFVQGSRAVVKRANELGNNDIWQNATFNDPISQRAYALNPKAQYEGLFQIDRPEISGPLEDTSPWEWWDTTTVSAEAAQWGQNGSTINANGLAGNPDMSKAKAMTYLDTIVGFLIPRMKLVLDNPTLNNEPINNFVIQHSSFPNPSETFMNLRVHPSNSISKVRVLSMNGVEISKANVQPTSHVVLERNGLPSGLYLVELTTNMGVVTDRIQWK
jgi:hypothetical protein